MNDDSDIIPVKAKAEAKATVSYERSRKKIIYDSDVFPPFTNKTKDVGRLRPRTFLIKCDGHGKMGLQEILTVPERLEKLVKLKDKGLLSQEEYDAKRKEIVSDL